MSKPTRLLVLGVINLAILGVLAWQFLRLQTMPAPSRAPAEPAAAPVPPWTQMLGHDLPGAIRWQGVWYQNPQQPAGALYAIAYPDPAQPGHWKATFAGYWGQFLQYQVQTPGQQQPDAVVFEGDVELGKATETYHWTARMTADLFEGQYVHLKTQQPGGFRLTPVATPAPESSHAASPPGTMDHE